MVLGADAPATEPVSDQTPQKFAETMSNDIAATKSADDIAKGIAYDSHSADEKKCAMTLANLIIVDSKLEVSARKKWGKDAEANVAHTLGDFIASDVPTMTWKVAGDKATGTFAQPGLIPMLLIRVNGNWKIDLAAYAKFSKEDMGVYAKDLQGALDVTNKFLGELDDSKDYPTAEKFEQHIKDTLAQMGPPQ